MPIFVKRLLIAVILVGAVLHAQEAPTPPPLTEVEQLRLDNVRLKMQLLQVELNTLIATIEKNHPGFTLDASNGQLVAKPKS